MHKLRSPPQIRGDIARIALYMRDRYGITFPPEFISRMTKWSSNDPVSTEECELNRLIISAQGSGNSLVSSQCTTEGIQTTPTTPTVTTPTNNDYQCGKKHSCSQMTSCSEARFYLQCGVILLSPKNTHSVYASFRR